jgi:hypothetical protein
VDPHQLRAHYLQCQDSLKLRARPMRRRPVLVRGPVRLLPVLKRPVYFQKLGQIVAKLWQTG